MIYENSTFVDEKNRKTSKIQNAVILLSSFVAKLAFFKQQSKMDERTKHSLKVLEVKRTFAFR